MYVDNCAMQLIKKPASLMSWYRNMFLDILSDQASVLSGSLCMLASAAWAGGRPVRTGARYSADIAGKKQAIRRIYPFRRPAPAFFI